MDRSDDDQNRTRAVLTRGTIVSHYEIIERIGGGGMGEVYLARDRQLDRPVALKFLSARLAGQPDANARFSREARAVAALDHPNIVTIHEVGEHDGRPFFAMQHVGDRTLRDLIEEGGLALEDVLSLAIQIGEGLQEAHAAGIVHRDIKPSNILISERGQPKLADFGLAAIQGSDRLTRTGSTLGTVAYMSPGQVLGRTPDHRSDIFSYGVVLYELLTGKQPFQRETEAATLHAILNDSAAPLDRYRTGLPDALQRIIDKALARSPDDRYQHADDVVVDLRRLQRDLGRPPDHVHSGTASRRSRPHLQRRLLLTFGLVAAAVAVFAVTHLMRSGTSHPTTATPRIDVEWASSIAVLPLRDFSSGGDQEFFCDGMTDAIIGRLSSLEDLKVISMTSVMAYKSADRNLKHIGEELGVTNILEGSIQREGGRIRVHAQLINAADDAHLWSETYDRSLEDVFSVQDDISKAIVAAMRVELLGVSAHALERQQTRSVEAYDLYARGRFLWSKRTDADIRRSIDYFEQAIALDPDYAMAYAGLADAWAVLPGYGTATAQEVQPAAMEAARTALSIDDGIAEAHASLGLVLFNDHRNEEAARELRRAIALNPGYSPAHLWLGMTLDRMGRFDESMRQLELALELDPLSIPVHINVAWGRERLWDWDGAEQVLLRLIDLADYKQPWRARYAFHL
ncbi:MAG: protein kinase, partial [Candidatus Eiseniibacteriota bacterium]